jgi:hypothetical protein
VPYIGSPGQTVYICSNDLRESSSKKKYVAAVFQLACCKVCWASQKEHTIRSSPLSFQRHSFSPSADPSDVSHVNFAALKSRGFKGIVFDKDNTLTAPYALEYHSSVRVAAEEAIRRFHGNVLIYSNHAGSPSDKHHLAAQQIEIELNIPVLRHTEQVVNSISNLTSAEALWNGFRLRIFGL